MRGIGCHGSHFIELPLYRCNRDSQSFAKIIPNLRASANEIQRQRIELNLNDVVTFYARCLKVPEARHNRQPNRLVGHPVRVGYECASSEKSLMPFNLNSFKAGQSSSWAKWPTAQVDRGYRVCRYSAHGCLRGRQIGVSHAHFTGVFSPG